MRIISFVSAFSAMPWRRKLSRVSRLLKTMLFMKIIFTLFLIMTIPLSVILVNKLRVINFLSLLQVIFPFLHLSLCLLMYALTNLSRRKQILCQFYGWFQQIHLKIYWLKYKSNIAQVFIQFQKNVERLLEKTNLCVQSDWGGEYQTFHKSF